jgi:hypothetical protein
VDHLSEWHSFDALDASTYPKVNSPMQVKYADGSLASGHTFDFFPMLKTAHEPPIRLAIRQGLLLGIARRRAQAGTGSPMSNPFGLMRCRESTLCLSCSMLTNSILLT